MFSSRKSKLAAVGAAGVLGALAFGGIAYAVGGEDPARSEYVTVVEQPGSGESTEAPRSGPEGQPRGDKRDCPDKNGGQEQPESPGQTPSSPSEQQPAPGSAEDL